MELRTRIAGESGREAEGEEIIFLIFFFFGGLWLFSLLKDFNKTAFLCESYSIQEVPQYEKINQSSLHAEYLKRDRRTDKKRCLARNLFMYTHVCRYINLINLPISSNLQSSILKKSIPIILIESRNFKFSLYFSAFQFSTHQLPTHHQPLRPPRRNVSVFCIAQWIHRQRLIHSSKNH